jgi:hypothetical protein
MIKIIAILTMLVDHVGAVFFPQFLIFRVIGRIAFPLFAWGIAKGYSRTRNFSNYSQRVLLLALVSQPFFMLALGSESLNICFTLFLGLMAIHFYERAKNKRYNILITLIAIVLASLLGTEYGAFGVVSILFFYIFKDGILLVPTQSILLFTWIYFKNTMFLQILSLPAFFIIYYFDKYDYRINRYFQYSFYPAHLFLIYIVDLSLKYIF